MGGMYVVAVVDDDHRILESLENLLESAGYAVRLFQSATELLKSGGFTGLDCLISDISMPVMDGFELQRLAKAARPELPVILITGRHEIPDHQSAAGQGHSGFFQKPFNSQDLLAAVSKALPPEPRG